MAAGRGLGPALPAAPIIFGNWYHSVRAAPCEVVPRRARSDAPYRLKYRSSDVNGIILISEPIERPDGRHGTRLVFWDCGSCKWNSRRAADDNPLAAICARDDGQ